ncbi:transcription initiation factor TAFII31 [Haematococcus lacustris]|uniref:Transcription initiation factor TFIID subunit 9 n=1 Tax=Haematococcus lacustris TaxID=44745 RepID=A0A699YFH5_HAELA|nr:uncharacterized protein HaLaN_03141 [Haematococcus lacustris]
MPEGSSDGPPGPQPQVVTQVQELLSMMGVVDYEPRVDHQLLNFLHRYVTDVLLDAETYAEHAGRDGGHVELDDVLLAIQARSTSTFAQPPDQDEIFELAHVVNDKELPRFPANRPGLLIPEDKDCLLAQNYQLNPTA